MHWFEQLAALYGEQDIPLFHDIMVTSILIDINSGGQLISIAKSRTNAIIPVTETSACRTRNTAPHPLCDTVQNLTHSECLSAYLAYLEKWAHSPYGSKQLCAVLQYAKNRTLTADLERSEIKYSPHSMIRFSVDGEELCGSAAIIKSHIDFTRLLGGKTGICSVSGETTVLSTLHPKRIVSAASSAKLISGCRSVQLSCGRFNSAQQTFTVGRELSFKAHAVLRRLISQGGVHMQQYVFIAFDESGACLPLPFMGQTAEPRGNVTVLCLVEATKGRLSVALYRRISEERYRDILRQPYKPLPKRHGGFYYERLISGILI